MQSKKDCKQSKLDAWYSSFPNEFPREFFMVSLLAYASSEKTPFPQKSSGINVFSSANTAEGAATDFDRVPFYRKMRPQKSLILNFLKGIISSLIYKVNRKEFFRHYAQKSKGCRRKKIKKRNIP